MERRGHFSLILGGLFLLLLIGGGALTWHLRRERRVRIQIFHWIQGSAPLQYLGAPPFTGTKGDNVADTVDPDVRDLLREMAIGGELRHVGNLEIPHSKRDQSGALLLKTWPTAPLTLGLIEEPVVVYVDQSPTYAIIPEKASATGVTMILTPEKNAQGDLLRVKLKGSRSGFVEGTSGMWWW